VTGPTLRFRVAGRAGAAFLKLLGATLRFRIVGEDHLTALRAAGEPVIFAFWHSWILPLAYLHRNQGIVVLVSEHGDGEYIAQVIHRMGFRTARGSSTRGGVRGAREMVRGLREGADGGITPDGPRGPAGTFKPGALVASRLSGAHIVPMAVEAEGVWRLDSWDRFVIPKPFARIRVRYGSPLRVPRDADESEMERISGALEAFLNHEPEPRLPGDGHIDDRHTNDIQTGEIQTEDAR